MVRDRRTIEEPLRRLRRRRSLVAELTLATGGSRHSAALASMKKTESSGYAKINAPLP
jgi:hypothetical protein